MLCDSTSIASDTPAGNIVDEETGTFLYPARTRRPYILPVIQHHNDYEIDEARERLDFAQVHAWLSETYWSPGIERDRVERAARFSSLVVGAYSCDSGAQAGYLRVISDRTTFGYLCDVYVDATHRGQGVARAMARFALTHPEHQNLRRWLLVTRDAQSVYAGVGFAPLPLPERWMAYVPER